MALIESETFMYTIPTIFLFLTALLFLIFKRNEKQQNKLPPGNTNLSFLVGETISFLKPRNLRKRGEFMENHISRYGKIFSAHLFGRRGIVSADPELNRFVLNNEGKLFRHGLPVALQKLQGVHGLNTMEGEAHLQTRSTVLDFFNGRRMRELILNDADRLASKVLSSWKEGHVVLAKEEATKFTFYHMVKKMMSMTEDGPEIEKLVSEYDVWTRGLGSNPLLMHFPGSPHKKALKSRDNIIQIITKEMEVRRAKNNYATAGMDEDDYLGWLMKHTDYNDEKICDLVLGVLFAGHDSTAGSISLLIYFLESCPKAVKQLREEHLQIVRSNKEHGGDGKLTLDDLKLMKFTRCVISEMLRLGNLVSFLPKTATKDVQFKSYTIPQGTTIQVHLAAVHLDPSLHENPHCFNPWRWMSSSATNVNNSFIPFGAGIRLCPGSEIAKLVLSVFLHHLVLKYDWELVEGDHPMAVRFIEYSNGLPIKVRAISTEL